MWGLLAEPHAGTAVTSVTRSPCAPAHGDSSSSKEKPPRNLMQKHLKF